MQIKTVENKIKKAQTKPQIPSFLNSIIKQYPQFFNELNTQKNSSTNDSNDRNKQEGYSSNNKSKCGIQETKDWIVYPDSEKHGYLNKSELLQLLNDPKCNIQVIKNNKKNAIFTIEYFRQNFMSEENNSFEMIFQQNHSQHSENNQSYSDHEEWEPKTKNYTPDSKNKHFDIFSDEKYSRKNSKKNTKKQQNSLGNFIEGMNSYHDSLMQDFNGFSISNNFATHDQKPDLFKFDSSHHSEINKKNKKKNSKKGIKQKKNMYQNNFNCQQQMNFQQFNPTYQNSNVQNPLFSYQNGNQRNNDFQFSQYMNNMSHQQQNQLNFMAPNNFYFQQNIPNGFSNGQFTQQNSQLYGSMDRNFGNQYQDFQSIQPPTMNQNFQMDYSNLLSNQNYQYFKNPEKSKRKTKNDFNYRMFQEQNQFLDPQQMDKKNKKKEKKFQFQ